MHFPALDLRLIDLTIVLESISEISYLLYFFFSQENTYADLVGIPYFVCR